MVGKALESILEAAEASNFESEFSVCFTVGEYLGSCIMKGYVQNFNVACFPNENVRKLVFSAPLLGIRSLNDVVMSFIVSLHG